MMVAADQSYEEQQRMMDWVLYISRRMFSLLTQGLSPAHSFCAVFPVLHDCSICNLLGEAILRLASHTNQSHFMSGGLLPMFILVSSTLRLATRDFSFQLNPCGHSPYVTSSLTRR
jgi:hypothetical protein